MKKCQHCNTIHESFNTCKEYQDYLLCPLEIIDFTVIVCRKKDKIETTIICDNERAEKFGFTKEQAFKISNSIDEVCKKIFKENKNDCKGQTRDIG